MVSSDAYFSWHDLTVFQTAYFYGLLVYTWQSVGFHIKFVIYKSCILSLRLHSIVCLFCVFPLCDVRSCLPYFTLSTNVESSEPLPNEFLTMDKSVVVTQWLGNRGTTSSLDWAPVFIRKDSRASKNDVRRSGYIFEWFKLIIFTMTMRAHC